jgi:hypothetical protein
MFLREAEAASRINHPNVVQLIDWGDSPPFIAFEFVEGRTMDRVIEERRSTQSELRVSELLPLIRSLVAGLEAINRVLVHRDIKPGNIFLTDNGPKISDLGLAKYLDEATRSRTFKGWGSLAYMAPETFRGQSNDWRTDQYGLGVVFYELATLERPFQGAAPDLERQHLFVRPPRITQANPGLPEALATVVARMLEKRPDDRFSSWAEVGEALAFLEKAPEEAVPDPAVQAAIAGLEQVRREELAERTAADLLLEEQRSRQELLTFWADEHFGKLQARIDRVNLTVGETAIKYYRSDPTPLGHRNPTISATFLNAKLEIALEAVPPDAEAEFIAWGAISLTSNKRGWFGNLVLNPEPAPYGTWVQVDLEMSPIVRDGTRPEQEDRHGGRYEIVGRRHVVARNWEALAFQQRMRRVTSLVQMRETNLDFDALADELVAIMTEDGAARSQTPR